MRYFLVLLLCFTCLAIDGGRYQTDTSHYLTFDGSTGYVTVPDNAALDFGTGNFSIAFWAKWTSGPILRRYTQYSIYKSSIYANKLALNINDGINSATVNCTVTPSVWCHVVFTADRSGFANAYLNGTIQLVEMSPIDNVTGSLSSPSEPLFVGYDDSSVFLNGSLDDIRIYKKALSGAEILAIYNQGVGAIMAGTETGLSWGTNADDGSGDTVTDITETVNGTITGGVTWSEGGVPLKKKCVGDSDMNGDGIVDFLDFAIFAADWQKETND